MMQTLALSIGLPVAYIIIGAIVGRCIYSYSYNNDGLLERGDQGPAAAMSFLFWPLIGLIFGIIYFITNGVRKQNKPKSSRSS